jgi:type IV pilus biogenesis protein PilP
VESPTPEQLASRVAVLERRLARYERAEAHDRARSVKEAVARTKPAASEKIQPVPQPIAEVKKPVALANDTVRVVGVSTHHGVTTALVDFGGVKSRVAAGDPIPGLGTVQSVAVDAAGNPIVEINGVRYQ